MKINLNYKKTARIISMMCGLLFSIFSIVYLYVFQTDVLEAMHFSLAHGKTVFSPLGSSLAITCILLVASLLLSKFWSIKGSWQSFAYIPAFIVLASFTDVRRGVYTADYASYNFWLYSSLLVLALLLLYFFRESFRLSVKRGWVTPTIYLVNIVWLMAFSLVTVAASTTDKIYHNELHIESCLRKGDNYSALMVAQHSPETSRTMTALRALALSREGLMGEKLFEYPQNYRSEGLIFSTDSMSILRYSNDSLMSYFNVVDTDKLVHPSQLQNYCQTDSCSDVVIEYYLSSLLLDKKIDLFVAALPQYYVIDKNLPKHYKEAMILDAFLRKKPTAGLEDSVMETQYHKYLEDQKAFHQDKYESTLMKGQYGKTYWWYYDYQH